MVAAVGFPTSTPYTLALDYGNATEELVTVTSAAGTSLTVTRGVGGTSAQPHSVGSPVRHVSYSQDFADSRSHENSSTSVHGVAVVVGTTEVQTLTNKTLTAPTINNGTWNNADINVARVDPTSASSGSLLVTSHASQNSGVDTISVSNRTSEIKLKVDREAHVRLFHTDADSGLKFQSDVSTSPDTKVMEVFDENDVLVGFLTNDGRLQLSPQVAATDAIVVDVPNTFTGEAFRYTKNAVDQAVLNGNGNLTLAGNLVAANLQVGSWTSWTPTWSATGGGFTVGNGSSIGRYASFGNLVVVEGSITRGTTTGFGTGIVQCNLPVNARHTGGNFFLFSTSCYDAAGNLPYSTTAIAFDAGGGTSVLEFASFKAGAAGRVSGSGAFPFAWAGNTGASIGFTGVYEKV